MAIFKKGDMWNRFGEVDLFCITTNGIIKKDGRLIMGAGIAKEARDRLPGIDKALGKALGIKYTRIPYYIWAGEIVQTVVAFQVKNHFREKADINLITYSCYLLLREILDRPAVAVALNFPGIGYGELNREKVLPIISLLPDNVEIWEKE